MIKKKKKKKSKLSLASDLQCVCHGLFFGGQGQLLCGDIVPAELGRWNHFAAGKLYLADVDLKKGISNGRSVWYTKQGHIQVLELLINNTKFVHLGIRNKDIFSRSFHQHQAVTKHAGSSVQFSSRWYLCVQEGRRVLFSTPLFSRRSMV